MGRAIIWIAAIIAGIGVGLGSAWLLTGPVNLFGREIKVGPWSTGQNTGEGANNPYDRARVAIYGIWALPPSEVLYYTTGTDDEGRPISERCSYEIRGSELPARWWSITVYRNFFWIPNPANRYSWTSTTVAKAPDGSWTVRLNPEGEGRNGLPLGSEPGHFRLSVRLYHPEPTAVADRASVRLPSVRRTSCEA